MLRTDLQLVLNFQIGHRNEERKAIIEFYNLTNVWINKCFHIDIISSWKFS